MTGPPSRTRADQKWPHDGQTYHARSRVLPESGSVGSRHSGHSIVGPIGLGRFDPMTTTSEGGLVLDGRGNASVQNLPSSERKRRSGVRPRARACSVVKPCSVAPLLATGVLTWLRNLFPATGPRSRLAGRNEERGANADYLRQRRDPPPLVTPRVDRDAVNKRNRSWSVFPRTRRRGRGRNGIWRLALRC